MHTWQIFEGPTLGEGFGTDHLWTGQFCFLMKTVQIAFILQSGWIKRVGCGMAVFIFSNDLTYLQLFVSITFANSLYKFANM